MFHKTARKRPKEITPDNDGNPHASKVYIMKIVTNKDNEITEIQLEPDQDILSAESDQVIEFQPVPEENIKTEIIEEHFIPDDCIEQIDNEQPSTSEQTVVLGENNEIVYISDDTVQSEQEVLSTLFDGTAELVIVNDRNELQLNEGLQLVTEVASSSSANAELGVFKPGRKKKQAFSGWIANRHKLRFQQKWLTEYPFLEYDLQTNVMWCKACRRYVNDWRKTSPFVIGTDNFRVSMIKYHQRSSMHTECQELADTLTSVDSEALEKDLYKDQLSHVFKSVYFIFKNKMPYTHYPQLCESQKREGTDFTVYTTHIKVVPTFGKYISMAFEKELSQKISFIPAFSLVIDASFRRNIESHNLVYLKYLDSFMVQTVFLGVIDSGAKLHNSMCSTLTALFKTYNINNWVNKVVYIMTDRSDAHMWHDGLIELIKSMSPEKLFSEVNFLPHKIKFCAGVVQNHKITSTFDALLWSIYCFYEKVDKAKRNLFHMNMELDDIVESYGGLPKNSYTTLYYEALKAIKEDYPDLVRLLETEQLLVHFDFKIRKSGARIFSVITRGSFVCKLALFTDIFACLSDFSLKLGYGDLLPYDVHMLIDEICTQIEIAANGDGPTASEIAEELSASPHYYRGIEITDDANVHHILPEVKKFSQDVIAYLKSLVDESLLENSYIFNVCMWPEDEELQTFGNSEFQEIFFMFNGKEKNLDSALAEWNIFKSKVVSLFPSEVRQNSKSVIMKMATEYISEFPIVSSVLSKILLLNFDASEIKRGYQEMCLNKSFSRSVLSLQSLQTAMMISMYGPSLNECDFTLAMELFLNSRHRKFRKKIIDKKLALNYVSDNEEENTIEEENESNVIF